MGQKVPKTSPMASPSGLNMTPLTDLQDKLAAAQQLVKDLDAKRLTEQGKLFDKMGLGHLPPARLVEVFEVALALVRGDAAGHDAAPPRPTVAASQPGAAL